MDGQDKENYDDIESPVRERGDIPEEEKAKNFAFDDDTAQSEIAETETEASAAAADEAATAFAAPSWRVARSLLTLRAQINRRAPNRNKASDGTIGDERHCGGSPTASDHCPWVRDGGVGVVTAMDITHDPGDGCDCNAIAEAIRAARDGRVKYIIWNRRIANSSAIGGTAPWTWRTYRGTNPHTRHIHISVKSDRANYDSTAAWSV